MQSINIHTRQQKLPGILISVLFSVVGTYHLVGVMQMMCAWDQLLAILPQWLACDTDRHGKTEVQEIRLRLGQVPELNFGTRSLWLDRVVSLEDLNFVVNTASRYSPWASTTIADGYITANGGHRIGICGSVVVKDRSMTGIRQVHSLCIRVARDFPGIAERAAYLKGSVLLLGPPGSGKTTLLRDFARLVAAKEPVSVVDERGELFPEGIPRGRRMDVLSGCSKAEGIQILLRTMGPSCIAVDEVTSEQDCDALVRAGWCGVRLLATAHAATISDLYQRSVYRSLVTSNLFDHILVMKRDKSWQEEQVAA